jgi:hypothetical protein
MMNGALMEHFLSVGLSFTAKLSEGKSRWFMNMSVDESMGLIFVSERDYDYAHQSMLPNFFPINFWLPVNRKRSMKRVCM